MCVSFNEFIENRHCYRNGPVTKQHYIHLCAYMLFLRKYISFGAEKLSLPIFALNHCVENVTTKNRINNKFIDFFCDATIFSESCKIHSNNEVEKGLSVLFKHNVWLFFSKEKNHMHVMNYICKHWFIRTTLLLWLLIHFVCMRRQTTRFICICFTMHE